MSISPDSDIVTSIKRALEASNLSPIIRCDISGENDSCGAKLDAIIVSEKFEGMPLLQRQKAVHDAIKTEMQRVHAFSMKTYTVAEAEKKLPKTTN